MGTLVFSANNVGSVIIRAFLPSFVFLCGFVPYCPFYFDPSSFSVILGRHEFRILSRFYFHVALRINFFVLKSLSVGACYWEPDFVQTLQSQSLCITEDSVYH